MDLDEKIAWDMYFASVTAMQFHPRNNALEHPRDIALQCAYIADAMLELRRHRHASNMGSSNRSGSELPRRTNVKRGKQRTRPRK